MAANKIGDYYEEELVKALYELDKAKMNGLIIGSLSLQ